MPREIIEKGMEGLWGGKWKEEGGRGKRGRVEMKKGGCGEGGIGIRNREEGIGRRKIRLIEGNAKCRRLKELTSKGTLRQGFICLKPRTPYPPSTHCIPVYKYTYSHREEGKGGRVNQREG